MTEPVKPDQADDAATVLFLLETLFLSAQIVPGQYKDHEALHSTEDRMHVLALRAISEGCDRPQEVARSALRMSALDFFRWCA
jgi:hypothetical protein